MFVAENSKKFMMFVLWVQDPSTKSFTASRGFPVEFTVQGPEWDQLATYTKQIVSELDKSGLVTDLDTNYDSAMPEFRIIPDRIKAAARGVTVTVSAKQ